MNSARSASPAPRENAPVAKQQKELVERLTGSLEKCPPGQAKAGCEGANRERETIGKQLAELSKAASGGTEQVMSVHRRMEAAEKALPGYQAFTTQRNSVRTEIDRYERDERDARGQIIKAFPEYVALTDPKPLSIAEAQSLLKGDEVMVVVLVGSERSFVWAVTRERAEWAEIAASNDTLSEHVNILRNGLDPLAQMTAEGAPGSRAGLKGGFDLQRAHELYKLVLGPVAGVLEGKRHLIVVPTGPLTSLPSAGAGDTSTDRQRRRSNAGRIAQHRLADQVARHERAPLRAIAERPAQAGPGQLGIRPLLRHG
jgi:hypothetical protein